MLLLAAIAFAIQGTIDIPLTMDADARTKAEPADCGQTLLALSAKKPKNVNKEPKYSKSATIKYASFRLGPDEKWTYAMAFEDSNDGLKIHLDQNHNGNLTDDPPLELNLTKNGRMTYVETDFLKTLVFWGKDELSDYTYRFKFVRHNEFITVVTGSALTGTMTVDGQPRQIRLVDSITLPVPVDVSKSTVLGDQKDGEGELMVDMNGDGKFARAEGAMNEVFGFSKGSFPFFGKMFTMEVSKDRRTLRLIPSR